MNARKAFTLIELLVVIAIIALLMGILMPVLGRAREQARRLICGTNMKAFSTGIVMYAQDNDDFLPASAHADWAKERLMNPSWTYMIMGMPDRAAAIAMAPHERIEAARAVYDFPSAPSFSNLGNLLRAGTIDVEGGELFYCPSGTEIPFSFQHHGGKDNWPYPNYTFKDGAQVNPEGVRSNYSYMPQHRTKKLPLGGVDWPSLAVKLAHVDPKRSVMRDLLQDPGKLSHKRGASTGCNMLYGDGAVSFRRDELLSSAYSNSGTVSPLWDSVLFRQLLKALE